MEDREAEDAVNDFGRDPIGEGKEEQVGVLDHSCFTPCIDFCFQIYNRELKTLLDNKRYDEPPTAEIGENQPQKRGSGGGGGGDGGGKRKRVKLEDLTRFTMVKRIW